MILLNNKVKDDTNNKSIIKILFYIITKEFQKFSKC